MEDDNNRPNQNESSRSRTSSTSSISSTTAQLSSHLARRSVPTMNTLQGDDDELQPSSSTQSFATPRPRSRNLFHHNSSLASPDSTYSVGPYLNRTTRREISPVVQDPCVVSSSTADEIPASPYAKDSSTAAYAVETPPLISSPSTQLAQADSSPNSGFRSRDKNAVERESGDMPKSSESYSSTNIPFSSSSFSHISPLRNEFKKASSFERFSAQAQASSNNQVNNQSASSNLQEPNSSIISATGNTSVTSATSLSRATAWNNGTAGSGKSTFTFMSSLHEAAAGTKPFLIKKLVARLANVAELERLEAATATALANESGSGNAPSANNSMGCDIVDGPPPSQPCDNTEVDSLIRRQLSQSSLNVPECSVAVTNQYADADAMVPSVSTKPPSKMFPTKKIPLTPKQKLLHRMQSGEIIIPLSTTPPPQPAKPPCEPAEISPPVTTVAVRQQPSPEPQSNQTQMLMTYFQQIQNSQRPYVGVEEPQQPSPNDSMADVASPERYSNVMNYEAFIRSAAGDDFSESMPKDEDIGENGNQIMYDSTADPYYYYGSILPDDEIFVNNNCSNGNLTTVPLCHPSGSRLLHSNLVHNTVDNQEIQFQVPSTHNGHLEFVLGLSQEGVERSGREDSMLETSDEIQLQQQQFLDANELTNAAQAAEISTLRNLLMMEPLARGQQAHDEPWISAAAAEYQSRMNSSLRLSTMTSVMPGSSSGGSTGGSTWASDWPPRTWQGQGQSHDEGEQDEVMDMSLMEDEKNHGHGLTKRTMYGHPSNLSQHGTGLEEVDLTNGLPLMTSIPLPMELQPAFGLTVGKSQVITDPSGLIIGPQHHQRNVIPEYDDEPVNLMSAVNSVNLEQALVHHSQSASRESENLNMSLSHTQNSHTVNTANATYGNIIFTTTSTTSTTVATAFDPTTETDSPQLQVQQQQPMLELQAAQDTNIDEKRIIRVKKKRETLESDSGETVDKKPNFILDKPVQPKSFASLPTLLTLTRMSGNGWGVVTNRNKKIPTDTRFGPLEGPLKRASIADLENNHTVYPVLVMVDNAGVVYQLDRTDDDLCNWMKFVRRARSGQEQNVLVSEEEGLLYFTSCRDISPKTELQVGYGNEYAEKYNLPYFSIEPREPTESPPLLRKGSISGGRKPRRKVGPEIEKFCCFECDLNFGSMEELNQHLDTSHADADLDGFRRPKKKAIRKFYEENPSDLKYKAAEAESTSATATDKRTLKKKEIERLRKEQEEIPVVESSSPDILPKVDTSLGQVQVQESASSSTKPTVTKVKCNLCYKAFATPQRLSKHMTVHNSDNHLKPLQCDVCSKRFLTNSALAGHSKTHDGKYFECPLCEFYTQQLLLLKEHVQTHKNEETGLFHCPNCPKDFTCYSLVRKHIRAFHGPRLYSCGDCSMKFPTPDKLKLHELRHSSFRAYLCAECGRQFKRKDKLTEHTRKSHGVLKTESEIPEADTEEPQQPEADFLLDGKPTLLTKKVFAKKVIPRLTEEQLIQYTFRCEECMIGFRRRGMLVNHLAKRHPEIDPEHVPELALPITRTAKNYFCPHCERVYKSSSKRKSHILKNHPGKPIPPQVRGKDIKAILDERVGSTTLDFNLSDFEPGVMENIKKSVDEAIRKEAVVGEIIGTPHACTWCHRQYATRAKLLQHQRKFHIELMPPEIQTPRPQKNNVKPVDALDVVDAGTPGLGRDSKSEPSPSSDSEKDLVPAPVQENMFGYLITSSGHVTNNEIESILQPEFMMSLLAQQNPVTNALASSSSNSTSARTITLCIPPGMMSTSTISTSAASNNPTQVISSGTQILTRTD